MPKIFYDFDQRELDAQYNNRAHVPDYEQYYESWRPLCTDVLSNFEHHLDIFYGTSPREKIDIILPKSGKLHSILLYIHGGYWMSRSTSDQTFLAKPFVEEGVAFGLIEYDLIPTVRMDDIVRQCRSAIAWLHANADTFALDRDRFHISGHSAGGHLTAMMSLTDWVAFCGSPKNLIKSGCAISGIYDLTPIQLSFMQKTLDLNDDEVRRNSPCLAEIAPTIPIIIAAGDRETNEFQRQSLDFTRDWNAKGGNCSFVNVPDSNHFSILSKLADPESQIVKDLLTQIKLN